jgi:hypothetical protein
MEVLEANRLSNRLPQGPRISVRRTGCLGACPDYTVTIRPDGHVEFEGRAFVATAGASDRVPEADARQMLERLDRIDFFHLDDCVGMLDVPQLIVEVQTGNGSHRVIATEGCTGPGIAELRLTARELEDTIRSQRWVGSVVPCGLVIDERIYFSAGGPR